MELDVRTWFVEAVCQAQTAQLCARPDIAASAYTAPSGLMRSSERRGDLLAEARRITLESLSAPTEARPTAGWGRGYS
jgi:hypothetical protein